MKLKILIACCILVTWPSLAEIRFSGYGSIVAGKVIGGEEDPSGEKEFVVDFYDYAFYTEEVGYEQESLVAIQMVADLGTNLTATVQVVAKGADEWNPDVDWAYLTYKVGDNGTLMAGRRVLPMYYFSEYMEVGFAYPWIRPPANLYWWEITQFNGLTYSHDFYFDDFTLTASAFTGRETQRDIESHDFWRNRGGYYPPPEGTYIAGTADVTWSDIVGVNLTFNNDWLDLRASYFKTEYKTNSEILFADPIDANGDGVPDFINERRTSPDGSPLISGDWSLTQFDLEFIGLGGSANLDYITLLFDYNYVTYDDGYGSEFPTYYVSAVYNHPTWQPYVGLSSAKLELTESFDGFGTGEAEEHTITTVGIRYNVLTNAALKLEYNRFEDKGNRPGFADFSYHNDAELVSVALDFIF